MTLNMKVFGIDIFYTGMDSFLLSVNTNLHKLSGPVKKYQYISRSGGTVLF